MIAAEISIEQTKKWIQSVVIDCNFCPFAAKPFLQKKIDYTVINTSSELIIIESLMEQWQKMKSDAAIETAFILLPIGYEDFETYLDLIQSMEDLLVDEGYDGIYQLASFHPNYCFEGSSDTDPANYTNRSPYPMIHIIREESVSKVLSTYPDADNIPIRNIEFARQKGLQYMHALFQASLF
jgi:hypothetical protein